MLHKTVSIIALVLGFTFATYSIQAQALATENTCEVADDGQKVVLKEGMLKAITLAYEDCLRFLKSELVMARKRHKEVPRGVLEMLDIDNYSAEVQETRDLFVIKFNPLKIREKEPINGGSVKYLIDKKNFAVRRFLIK